VAELLSYQFNRGRYNVVWDASNKPSGVYLVRMKSDDFVAARRIVLLK